MVAIPVFSTIAFPGLSVDAAPELIQATEKTIIAIRLTSDMFEDFKIMLVVFILMIDSLLCVIGLDGKIIQRICLQSGINI